VTVAVAAGALGLAVSLRPDVAVCPAVRPARPLPDTLLARARQSINATATGVGASYGALQHGERCRGPRLQVSLVRQGYPRGGVMVGELFVAPPRPTADRQTLSDIGEHEQAHSRQWAVATLAGGPLAFPLAYFAAELLFPRPNNPFERAAGLTKGG
jgi:hypothetical protein